MKIGYSGKGCLHTLSTKPDARQTVWKHLLSWHSLSLVFLWLCKWNEQGGVELGLISQLRLKSPSLTSWGYSRLSPPFPKEDIRQIWLLFSRNKNNQEQALVLPSKQSQMPVLTGVKVVYLRSTTEACCEQHSLLQTLWRRDFVYPCADTELNTMSLWLPTHHGVHGWWNGKTCIWLETLQALNWWQSFLYFKWDGYIILGTTLYPGIQQSMRTQLLFF